MHPVLKIRRQQLPLAPAFAMTSHAAQGQTLTQGAIVDLCIGKGSNPLGSYVALTRVTRREHLLIYRPFQRDLFTKGEKDGPEYLLKLLRGEDICWKDIEEKYMPRRRCVSCNAVKFKEYFTAGQFNREDKICFCKECVLKKENCNTPYRCNTCGLWKNAESFKREWLHPQCLQKRVCTTCVETRQCRGLCAEWKEMSAFKPSEWVHAGYRHGTRGKCKECQMYGKESKICAGCKKYLPFQDFGTTKAWEQNDANRKCTLCRRAYGVTHKICSVCTRKLPRSAYGLDDQWYANTSDRKCGSCRKDKSVHGQWKCVGCGGTKSKEAFSKWLLPNPKRKKDRHTRCNGCIDEAEAEKEEIRQESLRSVVRIQHR